jgi:hypothetical protein
MVQYDLGYVKRYSEGPEVEMIENKPKGRKGGRTYWDRSASIELEINGVIVATGDNSSILRQVRDGYEKGHKFKVLTDIEGTWNNAIVFVMDIAYPKEERIKTYREWSIRLKRN